MMKSNVGLQVETFWVMHQEVHGEEGQTASQPTISSHSRFSRTEALQARWKTASLRTSWPINKGCSLSRADLQNHPPQPTGHPQQILKRTCPPGHPLSLLPSGWCCLWIVFTHKPSFRSSLSPKLDYLCTTNNNCMWQIKLIFI